MTNIKWSSVSGLYSTLKISASGNSESISSPASHATWFPAIYISFVALDKPWILCAPKEIKNVFQKQKVLFFIALNHPAKFKLWERNFFILSSGRTNLPAAIELIFCGMCWWTIGPLIWRSWTRCSQHRPASLEWTAVRDAVKSFPLDLISIVITWQKKH